VARTFQFWDRATRTLVAEFDFERLRDETAYRSWLQTEQHKLANMCIAQLKGDVRFGVSGRQRLPG
jgi:3-(3-hydroxy-phenyl)propionate hydroxylase